MAPDHTLIDDVLNRKADPTQRSQVEAWFATAEGELYLSDRMEREFFAMDEQTVSHWVDHRIPSERMKDRFLSHISPRKSLFRLWYRVAAVVIPFVLLSGMLAFVATRTGVFSTPEFAEFTVPAGEQLRVVLQDGTVVHLNSSSRLRYPKSFGLFSRKVELSGEGFFMVAQEKHRPFVVDMNQLKVRVTGTKFDAKAYPFDSRIYVTLEEGSVSLTDVRKNEYPLVPGESAEYDKQSGQCTISKPADLSPFVAWRTNSLNFYRSPLRDILQTLERQYDAQFTLSDSILYRQKFTLSTSKVNLREILSDLERVSHIRFEPTGENSFAIEQKEVEPSR